ncbi:MAG: hypothetical protein SFV51_17005 [Bryobacteraceae bacterium]|nr:hypothetical protein [Bryobacteraceae bacterium]
MTDSKLSRTLAAKYDGAKFLELREANGWAQKSVPGFGGNADSTQRRVGAIERGEPGVPLGDYRIYAKALDKPLEYFLRAVLVDSATAHALGHTCTALVTAADRAAHRTLARPWGMRTAETLDCKITGLSPGEDPTQPVDYSTSSAMRALISLLANQNDHPFSHGVLVIDEETGVEIYPAGARTYKYILQCDSADDTVAFERKLGGTCLASVYQKGAGLIAASASDYMRGLIYSRVRGASTQAIRFRRKLSGRRDAFGSIYYLHPTARKELKGATINLYLGHANRIGLCAAHAPKLCDRRDVSIVSYGGSRGPLLVADGSIDAALEFTKGFRLLDALPGLFLADGAGAVVRGLDEHGAFDLHGPYTEMEAILETKPRKEWPKGLDRYRVRFVVAATPELAEELAGHVDTPFGAPSFRRRAAKP